VGGVESEVDRLRALFELDGLNDEWEDAKEDIEDAIETASCRDSGSDLRNSVDARRVVNAKLEYVNLY